MPSTTEQRKSDSSSRPARRTPISPTPSVCYGSEGGQSQQYTGYGYAATHAYANNTEAPYAPYYDERGNYVSTRSANTMDARMSEILKPFEKS